MLETEGGIGDIFDKKEGHASGIPVSKRRDRRDIAQPRVLKSIPQMPYCEMKPSFL